MNLLTATILALVAGQDGNTSRALATVTLGPPGDAQAQTITLSMIGGEMSPNRQSWTERSWQAVRRSPHGAETVTSDTCPGLKDVAVKFRDLPPILPAPSAALSREDPFPPNVIMLHGFRAMVSFTVAGGPDVTVSGVNAYAVWGTEVANALIPCWSQPFP